MQEQENNQLENFDNTWSTLGKKWNYVKRNYHSKNGKTRIKVFWDWKKIITNTLNTKKTIRTF